MSDKLILVVEDDAIIASMICGTLLDAGYRQPVTVASGEAALDVVKSNSPSLILMDVQLAGNMDGVTAADKIHSLSDVPIIYLTAYAEDQLLERAKASVPYGYLVKPVSNRELKASVEMALYRHAIDQKLAESERSLRESEELSRALLDLGGRNGEAIVMLQDQRGLHGVCVYANEPFCRITGFTQEELSGVQLFDLIHPRDRAAALWDHQRRMAGNETSGFTEMTLITRSGQDVAMECTFASSYYRGHPAAVGFMRDLSTRRMNEEQAVANERLAAIGTVAASIAGALDCDLSGLCECCEALSHSPGVSERDTDILRDVHSHVDDASILTQNLLEFVDGHDAGCGPLAVNQAIETVLRIRSMAPALPEIPVKAVYETNLPLVVADGYRLRQVILNILCNADYVMTQTHSAGAIAISTETHDDFVRIVIGDNGPGVATGDVDGLLGPSFLKSMFLGGAGLSMNVCRRIVEASGGGLSIECQPGKGTTYFIDLPAVTGMIV